MNQEKVLFKKMRAGAIIPKYATPGSSGMDLCAIEHATINPGEIKLIPTGLQMELPPNTEAQIRPRSGLAMKSGITIPNSPGTIDNDYRGDIGILLQNLGKEPFNIKPGDRIAQMVIVECRQYDVTEVIYDLSQTERGAGGFGSTGVSNKPRPNGFALGNLSPTPHTTELPSQARLPQKEEKN